MKHGSLYTERGCAHSSLWMEEVPKASRREGGKPALCQVRSGKKPCLLVEGQEVKITDVEKFERYLEGKHMVLRTSKGAVIVMGKLRFY